MNESAKDVEGSAMPDFVIAGVARAGTTSLSSWLGQHPDIHVSPVKETNFFSRPDLGTAGPGDAPLDAVPIELPDGNFAPVHVAGIKTWTDYVRCLQPTKTDVLIRGEASPSYAYYPRAATRIAAANPDCKIVLTFQTSSLPAGAQFNSADLLLVGATQASQTITVFLNSDPNNKFAEYVSIL